MVSKFDLLRLKLNFLGQLKLQMVLFGAVLEKTRLSSYVPKPKVTDSRIKSNLRLTLLFLQVTGLAVKKKIIK